MLSFKFLQRVNNHTHMNIYQSADHNKETSITKQHEEQQTKQTRKACWQNWIEVLTPLIPAENIWAWLNLYILLWELKSSNCAHVRNEHAYTGRSWQQFCNSTQGDKQVSIKSFELCPKYCKLQDTISARSCSSFNDTQPVAAYFPFQVTHIDYCNNTITLHFFQCKNSFSDQPH